MSLALVSEHRADFSDEGVSMAEPGDPLPQCPPHHWLIEGVAHEQVWTCLRCGAEHAPAVPDDPDAAPQWGNKSAKTGAPPPVCRRGLTSRRGPWRAGCGIRYPGVGVYEERRYFFAVASLGAPFLPAALPPLGFFAPPLLPGPLSGIVPPPAPQSTARWAK